MNATSVQTQSRLLSTLLPAGISLPASGEIALTGIELDSRRIKQGGLFMACRGAGADGRHFVAQAIEQGAAAVLVEQDEDWNTPQLKGAVPVIPVPDLPRRMSGIAARFYGEPARNLRLVGITGTNGKTTTCHLTARLFSALGYRCGVVGTLGYGVVGNELRHDSGVPATTPDAVSLQRQLARLRDDECNTVVMEVSSHGLDQFRVGIDDFAVGVFTNLTRDHLDYHGDMVHYAAAKRKLFRGRQLQVAVLNEDDACSRDTRALLAPGVRCMTWSLGNEAADVCCDAVHFGPGGMSLQITTPWGRHTVETSLLGSFNVSNLLAALTTVLACESGKEGFDAERVVDRLAILQAVAGRMQKIDGNWPFTVVVDYAHTPDGLEKALQAVREHCNGRVIAMFGCGGNRDKGKRPEMAAIAEANAELLVLTDDNPRHESSLQIIRDMQAGLSHAAHAVVEPDRRKAIAHAISLAGRGDVVLLAGKGHEDYQEVAGHRFAFSDADVAAEILHMQFRATGQEQA
jgi:UDP-N-acetylmuramoyl-L-alanyl-D-glutamate--2,6-diaminopimelate ligase